MKTLKWAFTAMAIIALGFAFVACGDGDEVTEDKVLSGGISISPTMAMTGTELTATYTGSENVNYQWNKGGSAIGGEKTPTYTPNEAGSYTVTVSLAGYKSKTSAAVAVTVPLETVAEPTADPGEGSYEAEQSVTLECATNGADIYYSLDGTTPSTLYSDPITISETTTLKALAKKSGMNDSTVLTAVYTINIAPQTLTGNISISPTTAFTGEELTATYSGSEAVNYQWNKGETPIDGKTTNKLTPTEAGSYTVTVSLAGYNSKTSTAVAVGAIIDLTGNISISPTTAFTGEELTATYSGSEAVNYLWNKDETPIDGKTTNKLTPTEAGSYTVTVSLSGYNSKTSAAVVVTIPALTGTVTIDRAAGKEGDIKLGETLTANTDELNGTDADKYTYQWTRGDEDIDENGTGKQYVIATDDYGYTVGVIVGYQGMTGTKTASSANQVEPDPATIPKDQTYEIPESFEILHTENILPTITGNFSDNDWAGVGDKIATALNDAFNAGPTSGPTAAAWKNRFRTVFKATDGYNIVVIETSENDNWSKWKATEEDRFARTLFLGFGELNNDLQGTLVDAITAIATSNLDKVMAKAAPAKNTIRLAKAVIPQYNGHARVATIEFALWC